MPRCGLDAEPQGPMRRLSPSCTGADLPDCGAKTSIKMGELIRCRECGHRVMYKPRTHKSESNLAAPNGARFARFMLDRC